MSLLILAIVVIGLKQSYSDFFLANPSESKIQKTTCFSVFLHKIQGVLDGFAIRCLSHLATPPQHTWDQILEKLCNLRISVNRDGQFNKNMRPETVGPAVTNSIGGSGNRGSMQLVGVRTTAG